MGGYTYRERGEEFAVPPLWTPQLQLIDDQLEIGFRDLVELRFVKKFLDAGLGLKTVRYCLRVAVACVNDPRPFSTRRFRTDGKTIFLQTISTAEGEQLLDLKRRQFVFTKVIEQTFKDLDIDDDVVSRWRPLSGKRSIVIDPARAFGAPIAADYGVPTVALAEATEAEGSVEAAAAAYEVPAAVVRDAVRFEQQLLDA
ncbi:hypothetical protein EK403_18575 [Hansschlegelia zhihuaiae]|uniref:DUF433 domain-containing protein n=2 Tax=Hansschlegelia zhihuaiae TaxID=405005 RepID=A0A4Q0M9J0_9HYPH|nr:hypothetical protein EK403_18575 [Hansschlegelia zhihuaiae]